MRPNKLLQRLSDGHVQNVAFKDLLRLARAIGFEVARVRGGHHILTQERIDQQVDLQELHEEAKPHQIRQSFTLVQ